MSFIETKKENGGARIRTVKDSDDNHSLGTDTRISSNVYGAPEYMQYLDILGVAGTNDNDVIYTSPDVSSYNQHVIECTAGTVDIQVSVDGTNFNTLQAAALLMDATAVTTYSLTIASTKIGILSGKFRKIRVLQNGATASNCRGGHAWV